MSELTLVSRTESTEIATEVVEAVSADKPVDDKDLVAKINEAQGKARFRRFNYSAINARVTFCAMIIGRNIAIGIAKKSSPHRGFNKKLGRTIAMGRAMKAPIKVYGITNESHLTDEYLNSLFHEYRRNALAITNYFVNRKEEREERLKDVMRHNLVVQTGKNILRLQKGTNMTNADVTNLALKVYKENANKSRRGRNK